MDVSEFEALLNFRDFGGHASRAGRVRGGRLFRSAALDQLTEADRARLHSFGLALVVDLRRRGERQLAPSRRPAGFAGTVIETADEDVVEAPHERYLAGDSLTADILRERVLDFYRRAAFDPRHIEVFRRGIEAMAACEGPVLIHCAAGKDRTGLFVALVLELLGVDREAIMADYLETTRHRRLVDYLTDRAIAAAGERGLALSCEVAEVLTSVDRSYLEAAWAAIDAHPGGFDGYVASLGLADGTLERLRGIYVEAP